MAILPARLRPWFDRRIDHWLLTAPEPWARWLGAGFTLRSGEGLDVTRRSLREMRAIEKGVRAGKPLEGNPGTSERVIEIPWALSRLPSSAPEVLDIGTANAADVYRRCLRRLDVRSLDLLDPVPADPRLGRVNVGDVREMPFEDDSFEATLCISTLEHVGMDNAMYFEQERGSPSPRPDLAAVREMGRVTRPGGRVLITVPAGAEKDYGWLRQYSVEAWNALVGESGLDPVETAVYVHDPEAGWRPGDGADVAAADYGAGAPFAGALICAALAPRSPA